jgi:hypothetical protein
MAQLESLRARLLVALEGVRSWADAQPHLREHVILSRSLVSALARASSCTDLEQMKLHVETAMHMILDCGPSDQKFADEIAEVSDALSRWCRPTSR